MSERIIFSGCFIGLLFNLKETWLKYPNILFVSQALQQQSVVDTDVSHDQHHVIHM